MSRSTIVPRPRRDYTGRMRFPSGSHLRTSSLAALLACGACVDDSPQQGSTTADSSTGTATDAATQTSTGTDGTTGDPEVPTTGATEPAATDTGAETSVTGTGGTETGATGTSEATDSAASSDTGADSSSGDPAIEFQDVYPLTAEFPEGGTYDPTDGAFYVGSLADGSVHRIDATTGDQSLLFTEDAPGTWWTLGMDVDVARRRLWVCAMDDLSPDPRAGYIWIFDLDTGERVANIALADAAPEATCTDVVLTTDGRGYVGDREMGNLYLVDIDAGASLFTTSPELEAAFVGQNSIVVLPDESALLSLLYLPSGLARIDLADGTVTPVEIDGTFSDFSPLAGADGMALVDGGLYVAFTSRLARVTPTSADWSQADSVVEDQPSGLTDVVATPGGVYLLNGQSVRFALGTRPDPFALTRYLGPL